MSQGELDQKKVDQAWDALSQSQRNIRSTHSCILARLAQAFEISTLDGLATRSQRQIEKEVSSFSFLCDQHGASCGFVALAFSTPALARACWCYSIPAADHVPDIVDHTPFGPYAARWHFHAARSLW